MDQYSSPSPDKDSSSGSPQASGLEKFWAELKRRKVMRVAITYTFVAWIVIQAAGLTFDSFGIPLWAFRFVVLMVLLGLPFAVIFAWAFELTPDGIRTTKSAQAEQGNVPLSENQQKGRNWMAYFAGAVIPTIIFGVVAGWFYFSARTAGTKLFTLSSSHSKTGKSIAVLPLENMSPDSENAFFADGVHEDILTNLSKIKELFVIGRTSTLQYRDSIKTLPQIGEELNVNYLVEGSVRRAGDQVMVTIQLIDAQTGGHLWAENYNRKLDDIFAIQAEIAKNVAKKLHATISSKESTSIERVPTKNLEAYDHYVRGRELVQSIEGVERSREFYERALELDPKFAAAHLGMGWHYFWMVIHNYIPPREGFSKVIEWLGSAKALKSNDLGEWKSLSGITNLWYNWDWEVAREELARISHTDLGFGDFSGGHPNGQCF